MKWWMFAIVISFAAMIAIGMLVVVAMALGDKVVRAVTRWDDEN